MPSAIVYSSFDSQHLTALVDEIVAKYGHIRHRRFAIRLGPFSFPSKGAARELVRTVLQAGSSPIPPMRRSSQPSMTASPGCAG